MIRALVLVVAIAAPAAAHAGSHCHEVSDIVGYQRCGRFGWWRLRVTAAVEIGAVGLNDRSDGVVAAGPTTRILIGMGSLIYIGSQLEVAGVVAEPGIVGTSARGGSPAMTAGGALAQGEMLVGAHVRLGRIMVAGELAPGERITLFDRRDGRDGFVLDLHPELAYWMTPNISLGVLTTIDLVHTGDLAAGIVLGFHLMPFDGTR
jgi:hypothetical protein